jgi:hypothetical protein
MKHNLSQSLILALAISVAITIAIGCEKNPENPNSSEVANVVETIEPQANSGAQEQSSANAPLASDSVSKSEKKSGISTPKSTDDTRSLFDGKTLNEWETIEFGGEGDVEVVDSAIAMEAGVMMTGICLEDEADLPKTNYEISLDARKIDGTDFFLGLTFPVADSHCTLIVGGWGGTLVGLSCINDQDASSNDTAMYKKFEKKQWYKIRLRVEPERITTWIDDEKVIDKNISLRGDTDLCKPLGMCNFMTASEYKNIELRKFEPTASGNESKPETKIQKAASLELSAPAEDDKQ